MRNTLIILVLLLAACGPDAPPDDSLDAAADALDAAPSDALPTLQHCFGVVCTMPPERADAGADSQ
jgi:hypothetical protein